MLSEFEVCKICPRECKVNRNIGEYGFCKASNTAEVSKIGLHFMEEPIISGHRGSGTIFFTHCNLNCVFCQNKKISRTTSKGTFLTEAELADAFLQLQKLGAHNINLVTPTHYMPIIKLAVNLAKNKGLRLPIVYNTGGFEIKNAIATLKDTVDIFLTDLKYFSPYLSKIYSQSEDYFDYADEAIREMIKITGPLQYDESGMLKKGVIIRHLVLPNCVGDSRAILKHISKHYANNVLVSLMGQYTPIGALPNELNRKLTATEYNEIKELFFELGLQGFVQNLNSSGSDKIPDFSKAYTEIELKIV